MLQVSCSATMQHFGAMDASPPVLGSFPVMQLLESSEALSKIPVCTVPIPKPRTAQSLAIVARSISSVPVQENFCGQLVVPKMRDVDVSACAADSVSIEA